MSRVLGHVFTSRLSEVPGDSLALEGDSDRYRFTKQNALFPGFLHQLQPAQKQLKDRARAPSEDALAGEAGVKVKP